MSHSETFRVGAPKCPGPSLKISGKSPRQFFRRAFLAFGSPSDFW